VDVITNADLIMYDGP